MHALKPVVIKHRPQPATKDPRLTVEVHLGINEALQRVGDAIQARHIEAFKRLAEK